MKGLRHALKEEGTTEKVTIQFINLFYDNLRNKIDQKLLLMLLLKVML